MPADDPVSALQTLNESDERQRFPLWRLAKPFAGILKLFSAFSGPGAALAPGGLSIAIEWLNQRPIENLSELVNVIADELKYRGTQIESLMQKSDAHRDFVAVDLCGLVLDGMLRAEGVRAKDRIKRLARILVHAVEVGRHDLADYSEEMLRIATALDERDVLVLREFVRVQGGSIQKDTGRVTHYFAYTVVRDILGSLKRVGFMQGEVDSICAKLESFGLVSKTERIVNITANDPTPYALLQKGLDFVEYIKSAEELGMTSATSAH